MDIRQWGIGKIMQLPDWCFGRRWLVCAEVLSGQEAELFDISEVALPDGFVLWNLAIDGYNSDMAWHVFRLALGDHLPATTAEMDLLEPLIMGFGAQGPDPRYIHIQYAHSAFSLPMRDPRQAQGRRLVIGVTGMELKVVDVRAVLTVSSIPKEVPDWLVSG